MGYNSLAYIFSVFQTEIIISISWFTFLENRQKKRIFWAAELNSLQFWIDTDLEYTNTNW